MSTRFRAPHLRQELDRAHPEIIMLAQDFGLWSAAEGLPAPVVTCIERDPEQNAKVGGVPNSAHLARPCRAIDFRNIHYLPADLAKVETWLYARCPRPMWGRVFKSHGTGPHLHLEIRE